VFGPSGILGTRICCDFGRRVWLCCNRINRRWRFRSLRSHAVADDQKNQNEQQYPDRAGKMPLIEICHLRPGTPLLTAIREYGWENFALLSDGLNRSADETLSAKNGTV